MTRRKALPRRIVYLEFLESLLETDGGDYAMQYRMGNDFPWVLDGPWHIERWGIRTSRAARGNGMVGLRGWTLPFPVRVLPRVLRPLLVWVTQFVLTLLRPRAGIMLAYSPAMATGVAAARFFRPSSVLVVRVIESVSSRARHVYGHPVEARVLKGVERFVLRRADLVLPISRFTRQIALDAGVSEDRIVELPFPTIWLGTKAASVDNMGGPTRVVCAGRLIPEKGFDLLIQAFTKISIEFPHVLLEIAGRGPERPALEALARQLGLLARVRFPGWLLPDQMPRFLAGALIAVLPSRVEEGLPTALVEAGVAGCALVGTDMGGTRDIVQSGRTGILVPANDADALAGALRRLLKDPDEARRLGQQARSKSLEYIERRESAQRTLRERLESLRHS
jgi:glycosyltransferase involved in cell wall biosynthesis